MIGSSAFAQGLTVRDIQAHLEDLYGLKVSPDLISRVTDAVLGEVREWQSRALEQMYPIMIFDALRVKVCGKKKRSGGSFRPRTRCRQPDGQE